MKLIDQTGKQFGDLTVLRRGPNQGQNTAWVCRCACGIEILVTNSHIKKQKSCYDCRGRLRVTHGQSVSGRRQGTLEYRIWQSMIQRCTNHKHKQWGDYGGRGITVCDSWRTDFTAFLKDMGPRPSPELSLDRIDNNGHYTASNCRWATRAEQNNNTRASHSIEFNGRRGSIAQWSNWTGIHARTLHYRIVKAGWPLAQALSRTS